MQEHYGDNQEHSWFRAGLHGIVEEAYAVAKYRNEQRYHIRDFHFFLIKINQFTKNQEFS